jgi:hypothetical protein
MDCRAEVRSLLQGEVEWATSPGLSTWDKERGISALTRLRHPLPQVEGEAERWWLEIVGCLFVVIGFGFW